MNIHSTVETSAVDQTTALRSMNPEQLRHLGANKLAYVRYGRGHSEPVLVLYGADGMPLAEVDSADAAFEIAADRGLKFIMVH